MVDRTWVSFCRLYHFISQLNAANASGLLARMKWHRVVLDEAQFIRNRFVSLPFVSTNLFWLYRNTRASKVVAQLRAKYRWMLTGTPVTNSLCVSNSRTWIADTNSAIGWIFTG